MSSTRSGACAALALGVLGCVAQPAASDAALAPDAGFDAASSPEDAGAQPDAAYPRREPWLEPAPFVELPDGPQVQLGAQPPSLWRTSFEPATSEPPRSRRGGIGVGNGVVIGLLGLGEPDLLTLHEAVGPGYERGEGFFSDLTIEVSIGGRVVAPVLEEQVRFTHTAIAATRATYEGGLVLVVTDVAPLVRADWFAPIEPIERALVRHIEVGTQEGAVVEEVEVSWVVAGEGFVAGADGQLRQTRDGHRTARLVGERTDAARRRVSAAFARVEGPSVEGASFALVLANDPSEEAATLAALEAMPWSVIRDTTEARWSARVGQGAALVIEGAMLRDLIDGLLVTVMAQQAQNGAISPISRYTRTWLRDTIGPVDAFAALGHHEALRAALDYEWTAIVAAGDLRNSMPADLAVPSPLPTDPGFAALGPLTGRTRSEGPSWVTLAHDEAARWTLDRTDLASRFDLLERAVVQQEIDDEGLLPFSGDETYRTAMAVALGRPVAETFEDGFRSLEASALLTVASERLAEHAEALAMSDRAIRLRTLATRAREALDRTYTRADGAFLPYRADDTGLAPAPFPDVSLTPAWLGYLDTDRARLARSIDALWADQGTDQGFPLAPPDEAIVRALPRVARGGLYTGMSPAMFLGACARADLPLGALALDAMARTASSSGAYEEYQTFLDHGALLLSYDALADGETPARHRPWESGLALRAILDWLVGLDPTTLDADGTVHLRLAPHLERGTFDGARVGASRLTVTTDTAPLARTVTLRREGGDPERMRATLVLSARAEGVALVRLAGEVLSPSEYEIESRDGWVRVVLPERELLPGAALEAEAVLR